MNATLPTGRQGQVLAAAILAGLALLLWLGLVAPLAAWHAARAETIERQQATLEHLAALAARRPALQRQLAGAAEDAGAEGMSDARAGAELQQQVAAMAGAAGTHLASAEFLPPERADGYRRIPLRVAVASRWAALVALLAAIETANPPLLIDDLHVRAAGGDGDPTPPAEASFVVFMLRATTGRGAPS